MRDSKLGRGDPAMSVYVGIDVHRKRSQVAVVTEDGTVAAEQERGERLRADAAADRGPAAGDAGGVRGRVRLGLAGRAAGGLRLRGAPGAPAAVQGDRLGAAEERQGRRRDPGPAAARGPAPGGVDRPAGGAAAPRAAAAPGRAGPAGHPAAQPDPRGGRRFRLRPVRQLPVRAGPRLAGRAGPARGVAGDRRPTAWRSSTAWRR